MKLFYSLSILLFVFLLSSYEITQKQDDDDCKGTVGDIKYSYLDEGLFRKQNGNCWVALEGQQLDRNSKLYEVLRFGGKSPDNIPQNLPDARNRFIRSMGDKDRNIGSYQKFATARPDNLSGTVNIKHDHGFKDVFFAESEGARGSNKKISSSKGLGCGKSDWDNYKVFFNNKTNPAGSPKQPVKFTGGATETRPNNITFYTYIRVN